MKGSLPRRRWLWFLPSALLILVAVNQVWLAYSEDLSPWKGGGFGMFASTDTSGARHLHALVIRPGIRREIPVPESLADLERRALVLPTDDRLRKLAQGLAELPSPDWGPVQAVELQLWRTDYDRATLMPSGRLLRSFRMEFDAE